MEFNESNIDDLDLSFSEKSQSIHEEEQEEEDILIQREPMFSVDFYVIYLDSDMAIEKIVCENEPTVLLENGKTGIQKDRILQFIQQKRFINDKKYKLLNYFYFHIPLEQDQLHSFIQNTALEYPEFMKSPSYLTDLVIEDSISIFHDVNSVFLFLKASEPRLLGKTAKYKGSIDANSYKNANTNPVGRVTKKVRFQTQ
jgi:hypothetical protein